MNNPEWCGREEIYNCTYLNTEESCIACTYYKPKMTFLEAWYKAKDGDKVVNTQNGFFKIKTQSKVREYFYETQDMGTINIYQSARKIWRINEKPEPKEITAKSIKIVGDYSYSAGHEQILVNGDMTIKILEE